MAYKIDRQFIFTTTMIVLLVIALAYIVVDKYTQAKQQEQFNVYQQGLQIGYAQAVLTILEQASTCQQVPLYSGNLTLNLIAVECLQAR